MVREAHEPELAKAWNPNAGMPAFLLRIPEQDFLVSRLGWSDWHQAVKAASPHLGHERLLTDLLMEASMEARFPEDSWFDTPWYESANYIADAVITAGWVSLERKRPAAPHTNARSAMKPYRQMKRRIRGTRRGWSSGYANLSTNYSQLEDFRLLGVLSHGIFVANNGCGKSEAEQHLYLTDANISAGWIASP